MGHVIMVVGIVMIMVVGIMKNMVGGGSPVLGSRPY